MSFKTVEARLQKMKAMADATSPEMIQALTRIALVLQSEIRQNIGRKRIIDKGKLLESINYKFDQSKTGAITLSVGSYGVPYAAINEFGGRMTRNQVLAMFASMRQTQVKGLKGLKRGKGVVEIDGKTMTGYWKARPYIQPAFEKHSKFIIDVIRSVGKY
jgi:phage gpG-like protein